HGYDVGQGLGQDARPHGRNVRTEQEIATRRVTFRPGSTYFPLWRFLPSWFLTGPPPQRRCRCDLPSNPVASPRTYTPLAPGSTPRPTPGSEAAAPAADPVSGNRKHSRMSCARGARNSNNPAERPDTHSDQLAGGFEMTRTAADFLAETLQQAGVKR